MGTAAVCRAQGHCAFSSHLLALIGWVGQGVVLTYIWQATLRSAWAARHMPMHKETTQATVGHVLGMELMSCTVQTQCVFVLTDTHRNPGGWALISSHAKGSSWVQGDSVGVQQAGTKMGIMQKNTTDEFSTVHDKLWLFDGQIGGRGGSDRNLEL